MNNNIPNRPIDIITYHNGNGLTVYKEGIIIAWISPNREVRFYKEEQVGILSKKVKEYINYVAKIDDRNISVTQSEKVFNTRPNER